MATRVLFLCTHNSARSQMAEGLLRDLGGRGFEAHSAGIVVTEVRPLAIRAMAELGIDIGGQWSKALTEYDGQAFDVAVTVCDDDALKMIAKNDDVARAPPVDAGRPRPNEASILRECLLHGSSYLRCRGGAVSAVPAH